MFGLQKMSWMRINSVIVGVILIGSSWSCSDPNPQQPLYEEEINIMTQVFLIESVLQDFSGIQRDTLAIRYYNQLYDQFGIDEDRLNDLRNRYNEDPTLWQRLTDSTVARFESARTDVGKVLYE